MRFYGEYCFFDVIPLDKVKSEYGPYDEILDHEIYYALYIIPYEGNNRRHHNASDFISNTIPGEIISPWDKGEKCR